MAAAKIDEESIEAQMAKMVKRLVDEMPPAYKLRKLGAAIAVLTGV